MKHRVDYNSLKKQWKEDPSLSIKPWQIEDLRELTTANLFERLDLLNISLDRQSFLTTIEQIDTPEDLVKQLSPQENEQSDQIYLLIFELWRRLAPEKHSLSIFCDELDHQIDLYEQDALEDAEAIQDMLSHLALILEENIDNGIEAEEIFEFIDSQCANDLSCFLYDFIADQIDNKNFNYAEELLEDFTAFISDNKWFKLLEARLTSRTDPQGAYIIAKKLVKESSLEEDLAFQLDLLEFLARENENDLFIPLVKQTLKILEIEEDFQDLLNICLDYTLFLDLDDQNKAIAKLLEQRKSISSTQSLKNEEATFTKLLKILNDL